MRFHLLAALLLAGVAMPADAQSDRSNRRIEKLEQEMRALQRRVVQGGAGAIVQPEIQQQAGAAQGGIPASSAVADLSARVDALEGQLARLTGQLEESSHRARRAEEELEAMRAEAAARTATPEPAPEMARDPPRAEPRPQKDAESMVAGITGDPAEDAYLTGYRLWNDGKLADARTKLEAMAKSYPKHRRASYAQNLAGRVWLQEGKPATAAKLFLANYQANPKGERAADSLYFLGQALVELKKPADACKVYEELQDVYPNMRDWVKERLPKARQEASCA